jgi:large subunit ribosomal protein L18
LGSEISGDVMATQRKKIASGPRERAKFRIRRKVNGSVARPRLSIFRSSKHTYAQVIVDDSQKTLASASTLDKEVQATIERLVKSSEAEGGKSSSKSVLAARAVGLVLAARSKEASVSQVVFDRNGFLYTGRVKALADGVREGGVQV